MARVVHFEIPAADPEVSVRFYKNVFGWEFSKWGDEEYWLAKTGEDDLPGINGAIMKQRDPAQPVVNTVEVPDLEKAIEAIEKHKGQIVAPKMAVPTVGWLAYFKDPGGYISGIMQMDANAK
ncbi:glyoxalase [Fulvivirga imtechensis AK7]|uniref:Glyoxalase n=1 Tax=Fulvivirga imtechensis AK7 TaxID=1237149 RepID=L8JYU7_9BACT|nr:VOC family protein [Fulvivirga imtechensis]ELR72809.1 glyoxalase [Fulvivirga imtechensis AK7]